MDIATFYFGLFWGIFPFTAASVVQQTRKILGRSRTFPHHAYLYMIWIELVVNIVFNLCSFLYLMGVIQGSIGFLAGITIVWILQTQLLSQIIANRVSLIMVDKRKAMWLKIGLFIVISAVNISTASFWNPGQMPDATPKQVQLMKDIERAEKIFFLLLDLGLSLMFLYLVRYRLIAGGLDKYWHLFYFNIGAIILSTTMDALLVGMLNLPSPYLYVQFAPVAYIVKLHVELTMATLITKVVQSGTNNSTKRNDTNHLTNATSRGRLNRPLSAHESRVSMVSTSVNSAEKGGLPGRYNRDAVNADFDDHLDPSHTNGGILRTVTTVLKTETVKEHEKTGFGSRTQTQPMET